MAPNFASAASGSTFEVRSTGVLPCFSRTVRRLATANDRDATAAPSAGVMVYQATWVQQE